MALFFVVVHVKSISLKTEDGRSATETSFQRLFSALRTFDKWGIGDFLERIQSMTACLTLIRISRHYIIPPIPPIMPPIPPIPPIPPMPSIDGAGVWDFGSGLSVIMAAMVIKRPDTEAAL